MDTKNSFGREAATFLKKATFELIGATDIIWKWVTIIIGQLRTTTDAKRPLFFGQQLYLDTKNNYGREAAAFFWATGLNKE